MSDVSDGMTDHKRAMVQAFAAYNNSAHAVYRIGDACCAYHRAMIAITPGLCVHEVDGTVRQPTTRDL